jgi:hypothetical protein
MAIILKANKVNLFVSSVLFVFWYHSPNFLDTPRTCKLFTDSGFHFSGVQCYPLHQCDHRCESAALLVARVCSVPHWPTYHHYVNVSHILPFVAVITISRLYTSRQQKLSAPECHILAQPSGDRSTLWCYLHL